jgi:replicative DNA helicase
LIRAGKVATPVTLKTFLPADLDIGGLNPQRSISPGSPRKRRRSSTPRTTAAPSTTLATRRDLIRIGEDMVNVAYDAPVDFAPSDQIEDAERRLYRTRRDRPVWRRLPALRPTR